MTASRWIAAAGAAGLGAVFLAVIAAQAIAIRQSWGAAYWVPGTVAAAVVCALALARRRQRAWTAVAGLVVAAVAALAAWAARPDLPAEPGPATALGLAVLVGSALRVLPVVPAAAVAVAGLLVTGGSQLSARPSSSGPTSVTAIDLVIWAAAVAAGLSLRIMDGRAKAAAERVRRAERLELARELHDVVAHHITGMLIQAQAARIVARRDPELVGESLAEIETAGTDALAAMRRVVGLLRDTDDSAPASAGPEGLGALVERFGRQGREVHLSTVDDTGWPPEVTSTVYRIVQESLTNVLRHSPHARSVTVTVGRDPAGVTVEVADDAPRSSPRPHHRGGYGLIGMRERVEALGGSLTAGPLPVSGWSVHATLPLPPTETG